MAADLFETYAVTAVAVMLLGVLTFDAAQATAGRALPAGARRRLDHRVDHRHLRRQVGQRQRRARALPGRHRSRASSPRSPSTRSPSWMMDDLTRRERRRGPERRRPLPLLADRPRRHRPAVRDHRLLHVDALLAGQEDRRGVGDRPRDEHHPGPRPGPAGHGAARAGDRARHLRRQRARRHLRRRRGRDGAAVADRPDRRARRVRPDHRQRRRHRRDGRHARGRPQRHRPARRGRQHDEGRHQGLRDRLRRARRAGAVRGVQDRAPGGARQARRCSRSTTRRC